MELKTYDDLLASFLETGKKYGFASYVGKNLSRVCDAIPEDALPKEKFFIRSKRTYGDFYTWVKHVTTGYYDGSEYDLDQPYDEICEDTKFVECIPTFAWFVKPGGLNKYNGKFSHILTDICNTTKDYYYNSYITSGYFGSDDDRSIDHYETNECHYHGTLHSKTDVEEDFDIVENVYIQNGVLYVKYNDEKRHYPTEKAYVPAGWIAYSTYEEVVEYQKEEFAEYEKTLLFTNAKFGDVFITNYKHKAIYHKSTCSWGEKLHHLIIDNGSTLTAFDNGKAESGWEYIVEQIA